MKQDIKYIFFIALISYLINSSCKKEVSCENCRSNINKPPIAIAGPDQSIILPIDSTLLDGSRSSDPDGSISSYSWTKVSGPSSFTINHSSDSITRVKALVKGVYLFELKVTDNTGMSAKDTVQISINDPAQSNHSPVANAGTDQIISLPANTVTLDGSNSSDPDNNIVSYQWTKISGPPSFTITNSNAVQIPVTNLVEGIYQFELKVTDTGGLFDTDTVEIKIITPSTACDISNRLLIPAQLIPAGSLSQTRAGIAIATAGSKIVYAGGYIMPNVSSTRVDIFDLITNSWSTAELSEARYGISSVVLGNKIFFAGGYKDGGRTSSRVDIYDATTNNWTTAELSLSRTEMATAALGNKVLFAGGVHAENGVWIGSTTFSNKVDIYDAAANTWTTAALSQNMRVGMAAVSSGNKIYFAGGTGNWMVYDLDPTSSIDIYDVNTNSWSVTYLNSARGGLAGIVKDNKIYWAGGGLYENLPVNASEVQINDIVSLTTTSNCLFQPNSYFQAVEKNNNIIFFTGEGIEKNKFDIYNTNNNTWSIGTLPYNVTHDYNSQQIISVNNSIYLAGISINGILSNQVWKLEF